MKWRAAYVLYREERRAQERCTPEGAPSAWPRSAELHVSTEGGQRVPLDMPRAAVR